jgi:hypothetical protein
MTIKGEMLLIIPDDWPLPKIFGGLYYKPEFDLKLGLRFSIEGKD